MAVSAVAFGIVALMLASGFIEWIYHDLRESTIRAHLGRVQIVRPGYHELGRSDPFKYLLPADSPELAQVRATPSVEVVAPRLYFSGLASHGDTTISFVGEAVSPDLESALSSSLVIDRGSSLRNGDRDGVLFGSGLARNLGVDVGDRVTLLVTTATGGINAVELTVRGLFSTVTKAFDDSALRLPIDTARGLLRVRGAHAWVVLLDDTARTAATVTSLKRLSSRDFQVIPWYDLADFYRKTVALFSKQVEIVRIIIAVIIVLSISNTMMMGVMERTGEIGTSMALGVTRKRILGQFVAEGAALGLLGGAIGAAVGFARGGDHIGHRHSHAPTARDGARFCRRDRITRELAAEAFALAALTTLLASFYPAWRASRLVIVDALRTNR